MNDLLQVSTSNLQRILAVKKQIDRLEAKLAKLAKLAGSEATSAVTAGPLQLREMNASARQRTSEAAKARWAKFRTGKWKERRRPLSRRQFLAGRSALQTRL
jgi:non-canonical (house-cleaning) NTP pyrophosphatase